MFPKRPKIEIGTTFPHSWQGRYVNAEVVGRRQEASRPMWTVRLTESQRPIVHGGGPLAGKFIEFDTRTRQLRDIITYIENLPCFGPARAESDVVQWVDFGGDRGLWAEIREVFTYGKGRNTHWTKSEYGDVESLLASGDAVRVNS